MIRTILVPVMGDDGDEARLATAVAAARSFDAHIACLHIRADPAEIFASAASADVGAVLAMPQLTKALAAEDEAREQRALQAFRRVCQREKIAVVEAPPGPASISAAWHEMTGDGVEQIIWRARFCDLLVLGRARDDRGLKPETIGTIFMKAGRPVLLAAAKAPVSLTDTIAIAWKDSPEAARAVTAAMPFLSKAGQIVILVVDEGEQSSYESLDRLIEELKWHGISPKGKRIVAKPRGGPEAMLAGVKNLRADLLVMGGYGHSRARERVLGGYTRHALKQAELPVLLCH